MKKNILITAISLILAIFLITGVLQSDEKYSGNVHEYLIEQSYELLKIDMEHEFPEMNDYLDKLKKGVKNEDKQDWVYNYNEDNPPDFNQFLLPAAFLDFFTDLQQAYYEIFGGEFNDPFITITHFWGADGGPSNSTFLSGNHPLYWSFYCENAMQKASRYLNGPFVPHYLFYDIHFEEEDQLAYTPHIVKIYNLLNFYQTGLCKVYNIKDGYVGEFHLIETVKLAVFYETLGRICHLMMDMSVPAHAHEDQHAAYPDNAHGDQYEGNLDEDFGFMIYSDNWYWNYLNTYVEKGGLIDVSSQLDPILYLMYTVNQIADFFASDDVDGDSDLPQGSNPIIDAIYAELEAQYPPDHPVRNAHEMNDDESALIRDTVFPFVIRATAGLLEWFAQENNLTQYDLSLADTLKCYFYSHTNPVPNPDETNKEISLYYITHNPYDPLISGTIEKEDGEIIWENSDINLFPCNSVVGYLPGWRFYRRVTVENDYTGPLTIKIYEDGILTKESTVEYDPSNKPPIPILFSNTTEPKGIYPVNQSNTYCSQLYYSHLYTLKINAPYQGDIDTWYKIMIEWDEDDGEHTYPLNNTSNALFNDNGTVDIYIPSKDEIIGSGVTAGNVRLKINDVEGWPNHHILCTSDAFNGLITTISYPGIIWYLIKQYTPGTGCPSIYIDEEYFNNILPLAENQDIDQFDYILLDQSTINPEKSDFQIKEDQNNKNFLDMVQLVGVGHSKEVEFGINNANGYIFPYSTKSLIKYSGKDSIITLAADDSLLLYLDNFNIPPVDMIYLKVTSSLISNKYHDPGNINKGEIVAGRAICKDTTGIDTLDVVGLHEEYYTSFTEIYSNEINFSSGVIFLKPSRDIKISEISIILPTGVKEDLEIVNIPIKEALSLQNQRNVTEVILSDDDLYFEFAKDDGVRFFFDMPYFRSEEVDYVIIANGRYKHIEEELINILEMSHYPNPFSISTTISFTLPKNVEKAHLKIYNLKGQLVKTYKLDSEDSSITWDGKNNNGLHVANGIYFYKLTCNNKSVVEKMIFLR